ncbi:MAG: leucine-rich repeat domain-containing protein [Clostridia bacterium]|nr:leucine-rich repeat domain-containing protein [Clostridia bacterium]
MKKLLLVAICAVLAALPFSACEVDYDTGMKVNEELVYTLVENGGDAYYIVGKCEKLSDAGLDFESASALGYEEKAEKLGVYGGKEKKITVPAEHDGIPVRGIGAFAFYLCEAEEVILPASAEFVSDYAFYACRNLKTLSAGSAESGSALKKIGEAAFSGCVKLNAVYLFGSTPPEVASLNPQSVKHAFYGTYYPAVIVPADEQVSVYAVDAEWAAYVDYVVPLSAVYRNGQIIYGGVLVKYVGSETSVTVSEVVESIGNYAFKKSAVTEVVFPAALKKIGRQSFYGCSALKSYSFASDPAMLEVIGNNAFEGCSALRTAIFPSNLTTVVDRAFSGCSSLDTVYVQGRALKWIYTNVFDGCGLLSDVFYAGNEEDFSGVIISAGNDNFTSARFTFNYNAADGE